MTERKKLVDGRKGDWDSLSFWYRDCDFLGVTPGETVRPKDPNTMSVSGEKKVGVARKVVSWLGSSIFGLAGTVLLVCWLLAYALEPSGAFARIGLVLAIAAYCVDLVREEAAGRRSRARRAAGIHDDRGGASVAKAA